MGSAFGMFTSCEYCIYTYVPKLNPAAFHIKLKLKIRFCFHSHLLRLAAHSVSGEMCMWDGYSWHLALYIISRLCPVIPLTSMLFKLRLACYGKFWWRVSTGLADTRLFNSSGILWHVKKSIESCHNLLTLSFQTCTILLHQTFKPSLVLHLESNSKCFN